MCLSVCVCATFVVFTDCESCTRSIFHKPGIYGSVRVWANASDVFRRTPSRGVRGRRAAVDFVVCFGRGEFFRVFFFDFFFFERTRPAANMRPPCFIYLSTSNQHVLQGPFGQHHHLRGNVIMRQSRDSEATEVVFCLGAKKPLHGVVRTGYHYLISLSVCLPVCLSACV